MTDRALRGRNGSRQGQRAGAPSFSGVPIHEIRFASNHDVPEGTEVRLTDVGVPGMVGARIRLPGAAELIDLGRVPIIGGEVVIPDERLFPGRGSPWLKDRHP